MPVRAMPAVVGLSKDSSRPREPAFLAESVIVLAVPVLDNLTSGARDNRTRFDIATDNRAHPHNRSLPDRDSGNDHHIHANPYVIGHVNRFLNLVFVIGERIARVVMVDRINHQIARDMTVVTNRDSTFTSEKGIFVDMDIATQVHVHRRGYADSPVEAHATATGAKSRLQVLIGKHGECLAEQIHSSEYIMEHGEQRSHPAENAIKQEAGEAHQSSLADK